MDIAGWLVSEKLDGVRAFWDGKRLLSRQGNPFAAPNGFVAHFPPFELDGELWIGRGQFEAVAAITARQQPSEGWRRISYRIFEVPHAPGGLLERLARLRAYLEDHPGSPIRIIPQTPIVDGADLQARLAQVEAAGGEGLVLRAPDTPYETGRSDHALKVKSFDDMEGEVIGYRPGKGKYDGLVGALELRLPGGRVFYVGSGLSDRLRAHPPPLGSQVTFKYYGLTERGIPRFASFMRIRGLPQPPQQRP